MHELSIAHAIVETAVEALEPGQKVLRLRLQLGDLAGVTVEVQGSLAQLQAFLSQLSLRLPRQACIEELREEALECRPGQDFVIEFSQARGEGALIPADLAPSPDCLRELADPQDCRYAYPFLNCTACGPR
ncbi:MAG: hypothetical protein KF760_19060 [Candidatus Eremiobacteraeota bacterium]|nr:hypothetical protein [Candidatus Eremiobacteraeota bacterium]MCW5870281.1 hypothetical protein [Candidatus Eremiobacteraeota bacterium]